MAAFHRNSRGAPPLLAGGKAPLTLRPLDDARGSGSIRGRIQAELYLQCPTWAGWPIPRWTRYGRYNEDGTLTVTRIMEAR